MSQVQLSPDFESMAKSLLVINDLLQNLWCQGQKFSLIICM